MDADEVIDFFNAYGPQGCLPRGTATFWSLSHPGRNSTTDQTVTDQPNLLIKCHLYHDNYGSDHRSTYSERALRMRRNSRAKARKAYERADWENIGIEVKRAMEPCKETNTIESLDLIVDKLTKATAAAVDRHTPEMRPSPYSKRWFTVDLKSQQKDVNRARHKWQESCAEFGRDDDRTMRLFDDMRER